jgi:hypothetical protein
MYRVRIGAGKAAPEQFDLFTDSQYAEIINQGMIAYYNAKSQNTMRLVLDINQGFRRPIPRLRLRLDGVVRSVGQGCRCEDARVLRYRRR